MKGEDIPWTSLQPVGNHGDSVLAKLAMSLSMFPMHQPIIIVCELVGGNPTQVELARVAAHSVQRYFCTWHIVYITVVTMALIVQYVTILC